MINLLLSVSLVVIIYMTLWFFLAVFLKRNDVADFAWGMGFIVVCLYLQNGSFALDQLTIITVLTTIWGLRLASHIFRRLMKSEEDKRYATWRVEWGKNFLIRSFLQVFVLQGIFMIMISFSAIAASLHRGQPLDLFTYLGFMVWTTGFILESLADKQLASFVSVSSNHGHIIQSGLWKFSRHPNYFGEITQWWGLYIITIPIAGLFLGLISPITITTLIVFVSGIPLLEKKYKGRPEFELYKQKTSVLIPWFPKKV